MEVGVPLEASSDRRIYGSLPEKVDRAAADQLDQLCKASRGEPKKPAQNGPG